MKMDAAIFVSFPASSFFGFRLIQARHELLEVPNQQGRIGMSGNQRSAVGGKAQGVDHAALMVGEDAATDAPDHGAMSAHQGRHRRVVMIVDEEIQQLPIGQIDVAAGQHGPAQIVDYLAHRAGRHTRRPLNPKEVRLAEPDLHCTRQGPARQAGPTSPVGIWGPLFTIARSRTFHRSFFAFRSRTFVGAFARSGGTLRNPHSCECGCGSVHTIIPGTPPNFRSLEDLGPNLNPLPPQTADFYGQTRTPTGRAENEEDPGNNAVLRYFRGPLVMVKKRGRRDSNPPPDCHNDDTGKHVTETPSEPLAHSLARESQKCPVEGL